MNLFDKRNVNRHWRNNLILLLCILVLFFIVPSFQLATEIPFVLAILYSLLVLSSTFAIDYVSAVKKILLIIGLVVIITIWADVLTNLQIIRSLALMLLIVFLFIITISLIIHVSVSKRVNTNIIFSAINGYLLLGIISSLALLIIDVFNSNPILTNLRPNNLSDYVYFSFVTLTTLGYGDMAPISPASRVLAMMLATTGQLYIAILIAMLVGKYLNGNNKKKKKKESKF
ncbi:MAG: hypothetical protein IPM71_09890 [Bacteroidota bacterium]|nr:MAG: hypothetical protein IPM71_09890 [Bacteroidota bacterium]